VDVLKDQDAVKQLASILKTNVRACKALGHPYVLQVSNCFMQGVPGGKVSILGGHSISHSKLKSVCVHVSYFGFQDRAISQ
jgi:hypothetical protein